MEQEGKYIEITKPLRDKERVKFWINYLINKGIKVRIKKTIDGIIVERYITLEEMQELKET